MQCSTITPILSKTISTSKLLIPVRRLMFNSQKWNHEYDLGRMEKGGENGTKNWVYEDRYSGENRWKQTDENIWSIFDA